MGLCWGFIIRVLTPLLLLIFLVLGPSIVRAARTYHAKVDSGPGGGSPGRTERREPKPRSANLPSPAEAAGKVRKGGRRTHLRGGMPIASMADLKKGGGDGDDGGIPSSAMEGPVDGEKLSKWFMGLYHEKQIGGLCAVHCLNNLIQGQVFDEVQLAEIAHEMDR